MSSGGGECRVSARCDAAGVRPDADPRRSRYHHSQPPTDPRRPHPAAARRPARAPHKRLAEVALVQVDLVCASPATGSPGQSVKASEAIDPISAVVEPARRRS